MAIIASDNKKQYPPAPEGLHQAVCVDIIDKGIEDTGFGPKHKVQLVWQLECTYVNEKGETRRNIVSNKYTLSLNEKAKLRQHLEAWRGKKFTAKELEGFDLELLLKANCQLQVVHNLASNGNTYANVQAIVPINKSMTKMEPLDYVRAKDRVNNDAPADTTTPDDDDLPF